MISFVKGELSEILEGRIVVETGGLGIEINVPASVMEQLPVIGEEVKIYTYFRVSEDAMSLYGFNTRRDLAMFEQLIGVSGIGPKGALSILSAMNPDELRMAILSGDDKMIATAPGIGAKTAQRVIVDLKDKVDADAVIGVISGGKVTPVNSDMAEVIEALVGLGYARSEATRAVRAIAADGMNAEKMLKEALRSL
ncbi:MAG: Holliday junction branch migration protein RuvA [Lachnospiraceae bacterium]|nr:Holliday junction branch migration protein RuvA [Lachnospiraceae bacterium]